MWNTVGSRRGWSAMALLLTLSGCTALSDTKYELGQRIRAKHAWEEFNSCQCEPLTCDYACGWKAGYYDVATGGTGCPPVVAPKRYWKPPVFCEHDPSKRDDWYCGFSAGAACAQSQPDYHYVKACLPRVCCPVQDFRIAPASMEQPSEPFARATDPGDGCLWHDIAPGNRAIGRCVCGKSAHHTKSLVQTARCTILHGRLQQTSVSGAITIREPTAGHSSDSSRSSCLNSPLQLGAD
jgi:hypothetical protein